MTTLRVTGRLVRLMSIAAAGGAITILVLRALATDPSSMPKVSTIVTLAVVAVILFVVASVLAMIADRIAARVERESVAGPRLTPEEFEAERLRETPYLARQRRQQGPSSTDADSPL